ncbi:MAG: hypothetical protein NTV61_10310 [Candidatus Bathyarchaeota archaeon]|nr:hypothetical protein [Candidatus Bathyarchaeota archaeon]
MRRLKNRRGFSEVISSVILTAVVLTVGAAVWSYAQSATTVIADNYVKGTLSLKQEIIERFTVERVFYEPGVLHIWIFNYGSVDSQLDIYVTPSVGTIPPILNHAIGSSNLECVDIATTLSAGTTLSIKVHSVRDNNVYYAYTVS